ncbi:MAG: epoxyqueuosine reductase QueH [Acidobacteriota bacterium]
MNKKRILVHICCAPDALFVMNRLLDCFFVTGYFENPNIFPPEEHALRLTETQKVAETLSFDLLIGPNDREVWNHRAAKYAEEPEKGRRCDICYAHRLQNTALEAVDRNFDLFTTVMTLSPLKKASSIHRIGRMFARRYGIEFLETDFKKKDGFLQSVQMSHEHGLYRQNYCGCSFSLKDRERRRQGKGGGD